jgi:hypothetical protein
VDEARERLDGRLAVVGEHDVVLAGAPPPAATQAAAWRGEDLRQTLRALARRADGRWTVALGQRQVRALAAELGVAVAEAEEAVAVLLHAGELLPRRVVRHPYGYLLVTRAELARPDPAWRPRRPPRPELPPSARARVWARSGGRCWYCGAACAPHGGFCVDHLVPRAKGGGDDLANLVAACPACNAAKGGRTVEAWRAAIERELEGAPALSEEQWAYVAAPGCPPTTAVDWVFWFELRASQAHIRDPEA